MDPRNNRRVSLNLVAGLLLLLSAILDVTMIRAGVYVVWYVVDLALKVFMAIMLIKRNRGWIYLIPLVGAALVIAFTRSYPIPRWGGCLGCVLTALLVLALNTDKLPALRQPAERLWFLPGAIGLLAYLSFWLPQLSSGANTASNLILALLMNALPPVSHLLMSRWLAEPAES